MGIHIRGPGQFVTDDGFQITNIPFGNHICTNYQARALRALGLLLADGTPTVGGGKTF